MFEALFTDTFGSNSAGVIRVIDAFIKIAAFSLIFGALAWRYFVKHEGTDSANVIIFPMFLVVAIVGFEFFLTGVAAISEDFREAVNPAEEQFIEEFYEEVTQTASEATTADDSSSLGKLWSFFKGDGGIGFLASLQRFAYGILSGVNLILLDVASRMQSWVISFIGFFTPLVIAMSLFETYRSKATTFIAWGIQVALWPIGWTFGQLIAEKLIIEPGGVISSFDPSKLVAISITLIIWTVIYVLATPLVLNYLIGGGTPGAGLVGRGLLAAAAVARFIPGKGQAAAAALQSAGNTANAASAGGGGGNSGSRLPAPISNAASRKGGVIVPQPRLAGAQAALPSPPTRRARGRVVS